MIINSLALLYPAFIMMIFTIISLFILMFARVIALRNDHLNQGHLKDMSFSNVKGKWILIASRHYENLGILTSLFYVCILIITFLNYTDAMYLTLAWLFVGFRILHSIIHLTYNNVLQRMATFLISNCFLITMIMTLLIEVSSRAPAI